MTKQGDARICKEAAMGGGHRWSGSAGRMALAAALSLVALPATAQVATVITPDTGAALTTGTAVNRGPGVGNPNLFVTGGRYAGPADNPHQNLFHSFTRFDLAPNDVAVWFSSDPSRNDVRHVVNRVTGGDASHISGKLNSTTFPNADFYFINPAGVVFGENFGIDVPKSFYVSTGATLGFSDGTRLVAASGNGSTFSTAPPEAFGFIGGQSGDLRFERSSRPWAVTNIRASGAAHFSGANIFIDNVDFGIGAKMLRLAAVGDGNASVAVDPLARLPQLGGLLRIENGSIDGGGGAAGDMRGPKAAIGISAGDIRLIGGAMGDRETAIRTSGEGDIDIQAASLSMSGVSHIGTLAAVSPEPYVLLLDIRTLLQMRGVAGMPTRTQIGTSPYGAEVGNSIVRIRGAGATLDMRDATIDVRVGSSRAAGAIDIDVDHIIGTDARFASSSNFPNIAARGGDISLRANRIDLTDSGIEAYTASGGDAGAIRIDTGTLDFTRTHIRSSTGAAGAGGLIDIRADKAMITESILATDTSGSGNAGDMHLRFGALVTSGSHFTTDSSGDGRGGTLVIEGDDLVMLAPLIRSAASQSGAAGAIRLGGGRLRIVGAQIESGTSGVGQGGTVLFDADAVELTGGSLVSATSGSGDAGGVTFDTSLFKMTGFSVAADTSGTGDGGTIEVRTGNADLDFANLTTATAGPGAAGDIRLSSTGNLRLSNSALVTRSDAGAGPAGSILLRGGEAELRASALQATTNGANDAGNVDIRVTGALGVTGGFIANSSFGDGDSGAILLQGGSIALTDAILQAVASSRGQSGSVTVDATNGSIAATRSLIETNATGAVPAGGTGATGNAGSIRIAATDDISLMSSAILSTAAAKARRAGAIEIAAGDKVLIGIAALPDGKSSVVSVATSSTGTPDPGGRGGIRITGKDIELTGVTERLDRTALLDGRVRIGSETSASQDAGTIEIRAAGNLTLDHVDLISQSARDGAALSVATGDAGGVTLDGNDLVFRNTIVEASSGSAGNAGSIGVAARGDLTITGRSVLSSAASGTGSAGSVDVAIGRNGLLDGLSRIDTDVSGKAGGAGDIVIHGTGAKLRIVGLPGSDPSVDRSAISSSTANSQAGGRVTVDVDRLELVDGGGIFAVATKEAAGNGGSVTVRADSILMRGTLSGIQATALGASDAGSINLSGRQILLADRAEISTNAISGRAGDIAIAMPQTGIIELRGRGNPAFITTSSGPGTGGRITIARPLAIISDGGGILALGEARGANVRISSNFLIRSADAFNALTVDGNLILDSQIQDVSQGIEELDVPIVDAFSILIGQCSGTRSDGLVSQFRTKPNGPYPAPPSLVPSWQALPQMACR